MGLPTRKSIRFILTVSGLLGGLGLFLLALLLEPAGAPAEPPPPRWERFGSYEPGVCLNGGQAAGSWSPAPASGCVKVERDPSRSWLHLEPNSLVLEDSMSDFEFETDLMTVTASAAEQFAWLTWNYQDPNYYHFFRPGPGGWVVGRHEPSGDVVFASAAQPGFPVGAWHRIKIMQQGGRLTVSVGGATLYTGESGSGRIGLASTGAHAHFTNVYIRPLAVQAR